MTSEITAQIRIECIKIAASRGDIYSFEDLINASKKLFEIAGV